MGSMRLIRTLSKVRLRHENVPRQLSPVSASSIPRSNGLVFGVTLRVLCQLCPIRDLGRWVHPVSGAISRSDCFTMLAEGPRWDRPTLDETNLLKTLFAFGSSSPTVVWHVNGVNLLQHCVKLGGGNLAHI